MRRWLVLAGFVLLTGAVVWAQAKKNADAAGKVEDEILKLQSAWLAAEARGDVAALDKLIASDFIGMGFGGGVLNKEDIIPSDGDSGERMWGKSSVQEPTVRVFGDTAVAMGRIVREAPDTPGFRFTMVYQKRGAAWQMIAAHLAR